MQVISIKRYILLIRHSCPGSLAPAMEKKMQSSNTHEITFYQIVVKILHKLSSYILFCVNFDMKL